MSGQIIHTPANSNLMFLLRAENPIKGWLLFHTSSVNTTLDENIMSFQIILYKETLEHVSFMEDAIMIIYKNATDKSIPDKAFFQVQLS